MEWSTRRTDEMLVGQPQGRVDEKSWEQFLGFLNGAIGEATAQSLGFVLDLAGVDYMSSRGLRVLTLAKREADAHQVGFILARPNERMREILAISRYDKIFKVDDEIA